MDFPGFVVLLILSLIASVVAAYFGTVTSEVLMASCRSGW